MSSRIDEIRAAHRMETDTDTDAEGRAVIVAFCAEDDADWPCDTAHLLAELARVTSERDATLRRQYDELQADNGRLLGRIKSLENDLEHALASVGAFRAAIEDVWAKSAGESGEDGFIVSYVIPNGTLHRAIGLARGTDAGGKLLAERDALASRLAAAEARAEALTGRIRDALDCLPRALDGSRPFSLDQRAEVMLAIEALRAALAGSREQATTEGEYMTRRISVPAFVFDGPHDGCSYYLLSIDGEVADADGCHGSPQGVAKAKRLIESINAIRKPAGRRYAMIRVSDVPDHMGRINQDAIDTLNAAQRRTGGQDRGDGE